MAGNPIVVVAQVEGGNAAQEGAAVEIVDGPLGEDAVEFDTTGATEEHPEAFPPFDPVHFNSQLLWLALTFVFLYVVMSRVALPRIGRILETRRTRIEGDLKEAERLRLETERALAAYETALAEARQNAHSIAEETRSAIKADIDNKRGTVEAELSQRVAEAEGRIQASKTAALANVDEIAADTAQVVVGQLLGSVTAGQAREAVALVVREQRI